MSSPHGNDSFESNARKRVGKACDRCRLKKSKCDGSSPCNRCKQDNTICVFGERKKSQDRVFPKGYVEMIEQQQVSITNGLRQMYYTLLKNNLWEGQPLQEHNGHPLTHDILEGLGVLHSADGSETPERFVDNLDEAQDILLKKNGAVRQRKVSHDSASSCDESVKAEPRERHRRSLDSARSTPASRTFSVSSVDSRKRSPETPASEHMSPALRPKKIRTNVRPTGVFQQAAISPIAMSSPESIDFGYYPVSVGSPIDTSSYMMPAMVSAMNYDSYVFPMSPISMDTNFGTMSNPSLTVDPQVVDGEYGRFAQTVNNTPASNFLQMDTRYMATAWP